MATLIERGPDQPADSQVPDDQSQESATVNVLHVINGEHYSGAERVQDLLAGNLGQFGFQVGFACLRPGRFPEMREYATAPIHETPMRWGVSRGLRGACGNGRSQGRFLVRGR